MSAKVDDDASGAIRFRTFVVVVGECIDFTRIICFDQLDVVITGEQKEGEVNGRRTEKY